MSNLKSKITLKRVISAATVWVLLMALNVTGVLWTFYRVINDVIIQPAGTATIGSNWGYGYGYEDGEYTYGYGYGSYSSPSTWGGGGGGGWSSTPTCTDSKLVCKESGGVYKLFRKSGVSCRNGNLGKVCTPTSENTVDDGEETTPTEPSETGELTSEELLWGRITVSNGVATLNGQCSFPLKPHTFLDDDDTFATKYITLLQKLGIVHGRDGNGALFVPESNATRFEFIKMTERVFCLDYSNVDDSNLPFTDVTKGTWQGRVAQEALDAWLVTSANPLFRGNDDISRIEAFKVLTLAAGMTVTPTNTTVFTDVNIDWMKKYAEAVRTAGIANGQTINGNLVLEPLRNITRAESAKVIVKGIWTVPLN